MGKAEIEIFIILIGIVMMIFVIGIILFIFQYRKRKMLYEKEKIATEKQHKFDILNTQFESQREAMQYIGLEIHDSVGQKLTLASLYSKRLAHGGQVNELMDKAAAIGKIIDESLNELRQLSKTLTNPQLASIDIIGLLKEEAQQINATDVCTLSVETNEELLAVSLADKNVLFRLLQEFIQNSMKHSGCKNIAINFRKDDNGISITASDNGKGFDMTGISNGIGLQNMKSRAEQLKADYKMISAKGKGTSIFLHLNKTG